LERGGRLPWSIVRLRTEKQDSKPGVIAIIIAIMVLELKVPHAAAIDALITLWPVFISYVLSFLYWASTGISSSMDVPTKHGQHEQGICQSLPA
jgi:hypothetical protein